MARFKFSAPLSVPMLLLVPLYDSSYGVLTKQYPDISEGIAFFGSFKSYGGTEITENGLYSVEDTAWVETWYRPEIRSDCRVALAASGAVYEVIGEPEDIEQRHQYLRFRVRRLKGGA